MHIMHPEKQYKFHKNDWICKYYKQIFNSTKKLYKHFKTCEEKNKLPKDRLGKTINIEAQHKSAETIRQKIKNLNHHELFTRGNSITILFEIRLFSFKSYIYWRYNYNKSECSYFQ